MAGRLKKENDGSDMKDCLDTLLVAKKPKILFDFEKGNKGGGEVTWSFTEFLKAFLEEVHGISCLRPLPPVIGEGQTVDLLKLQIVVRKRGGYCSVSENGLWSSVAVDCGLDLRFSAALKLVYVKYLDTLDRWLRKTEKYREEGGSDVEERYIHFSRFLVELDSDPKVFTSGITSKVENDDEFVELKKREFGGVNENMGFVEVNVDVKSFDEKRGNNQNIGSGNVNVNEKQCVDKGGDGDVLRMDEDPVSKKRKRECYTGLLNWIRKVAKDPVGPAVEPLPERQKWKGYGSELQWKQILLVREAMRLRKNVDAGPEQTVWQKKQKMHPSMYDDDQCGSERLRCSQRILSSKDSSRKERERGGAESSSSGCLSDDDNADKQSDSTYDSPTYLNCRKKRIPTGSHHQADLPEFQGGDYESDPKWLGIKIWPLDISEQKKKSLIERDRIGKGRQESCGCQFVGSVECVRFHVREKRLKVKLELGTAFYLWKFDVMGEDVCFSWTKDDQTKFQHLVQSNPLSAGKYFWDELFKNFPKKGREALVSYYFNVFLLQRRGLQNRTSPSNIDSDDEDSEYGPIANRFGAGSIFCSPKKPHSKSR